MWEASHLSRHALQGVQIFKGDGEENKQFCEGLHVGGCEGVDVSLEHGWDAERLIGGDEEGMRAEFSQDLIECLFVPGVVG